MHPAIDLLPAPWKVILEEEIADYMVIVEMLPDNERVRVSLFDTDRLALQFREHGKPDHVAHGLKPYCAALKAIEKIASSPADSS